VFLQLRQFRSLLPTLAIERKRRADRRQQFPIAEGFGKRTRFAPPS